VFGWMVSSMRAGGYRGRSVPCALGLTLLLSACGGSGSGAPSSFVGGSFCGTASCATSSAAVASNASAQTVALPGLSGFAGALTFPGGTQAPSGATVQLTVETVPSDVAALQSHLRRPAAVGVTSAQLYVVLRPAQTIVLPAFPAFSFTLPAALANAGLDEYLAFSDSTQGGYRVLYGPVRAAGGVVTFAGSSAPLTLVAGQTYVFALYGVTPPSAPIASPSSVAFVTPGQTQTVTVSEPNYGGSFGASSSNSAIVTVTPVSGTSFTLTAGATAGATTVVVTDGAGRATSIAVGLTVTSGSIH
jgi:hypothetical protein